MNLTFMSLTDFATQLRAYLQKEESGELVKYRDVVKSIGITDALERLLNELTGLVYEEYEPAESLIGRYWRIVELLYNIEDLLDLLSDYSYLYDSSLSLNLKTLAVDIRNLAHRLNAKYYDCVRKSSRELTEIATCLKENLEIEIPKIREVFEKFTKKISEKLLV